VRNSWKLWTTCSLIAIFVAALTLPPSRALADVTQDDIVGSLDVTASSVVSSSVIGDGRGVTTLSGPIEGFPTKGSSYLVLSTGDAAALPGDPATFSSTDLPDAAAGADGNDLTQVQLQLRPPTTATCVGFDFSFLSEEYPEFVGSAFNDIFTAELNESKFGVENNQVIAPNNFAYDSKGNAVSINTVFGMAPIPGTTMDGATPPLSAISPIEKHDDGTMELFLSVQDLGDSVYDSAVIIDNLRWLVGSNCSPGATELTDTDADGLPDTWETQGIDYDNDGAPELDLPAMGADPKHKDIFIEVDWMKKPATCLWIICWGGQDFAPQQAALDDARAAFAAAPVSNPDQTSGIRLHIDSGPNSVMDPRNGGKWGSRSRAAVVPFQASLGTMNGTDYDWSAFEAIKNSSFDIFRRDAFHYVIYADTYANSDSSGISRGIPSSDLLITDGASGWGGGFTRTQERGTFMHELGHNLSLRHGGGDDNNNKPDYISIMNYLFQLTGLPPDSHLDYSRGTPFNDWDHLRFDGGSVGDLGDASPLPTSTAADETLDPTTAKQNNAFARSGDGLVSFVGPNVLLPGTGTQKLSFDVTNQGPIADTFTVQVASTNPNIGGTLSAPVQAGKTVRVQLPVDTVKLTPSGPIAVTAELSSATGGASLSSDSGEVTVPDMNDPAVRAAAQDALKQLDGLPADSGLDPSVKADLAGMLASGLQPQWTATLRVQGSRTFTQTYTVDPPQFTPSQTSPTSISVTSVAATTKLSLTVTRISPKGQPPVYKGALQAATSTGPTLVGNVVGGWNPKTKTFAGTWQASRAAGVLQLELHEG
jgi:hypothetical protein